MSFYKFPGTVKCVSVEDQPDGSAKVVFEADEKFKHGFKKYYNLKKWSQKRFNKFLEEAITNMVNVLNEDNDQKKEEIKY
jgi:hypothetical protein